jgi:uncharacterized protein YecE (DUF72 family)
MAGVFIGTSGFDYKEWKPDFYPADLPRRQFLNYYASHFPIVELNNTFYQLPNAQKLASWSAATPDNFRFAMKASRRITHQERLKIPSETLRYFLQAAVELKHRLGPLLFQLPPFFKSDPEKLAAFLEVLPREIPTAFEFRHDSWFTDPIYQLLEKNGVALCINDGDEKTTPILVTAGFAYLRLRKSEYSPELRQEWQERIRGWINRGIDVFAFVKHEDNPNAPLVASEFAVLWSIK